MRRLLPDRGEAAVAQQLEPRCPWERANDARPHTAINFAVTLDGRAAINGRSGPIGSSLDTEMLQRLRTRFDAVMVGAGTLRIERYGRVVSDPDLRAERVEAGLTEARLAVVISNRLDLPWDAPLSTNGHGRVVAFTASESEPPETATPVECVHQPDGVALAAAMRHLREAEGIRSVLCEGGPPLHADLQMAGLVDELFLTIAPKLAGIDGPSLIEGPLHDPLGLDLEWLLEAGGELFARYAMADPAGS